MELGKSRPDFGIIITIVLVAAGIIAQWTIVAQKTAEIDAIKAQLEVHRLDSRHHVDPERDETRWQELIRRLERIEKKLDDAK